MKFHTSSSRHLTRSVMSAFAIAATLVAGAAQAALLGVQPGYPQMTYDNTGVTNFDSSTMKFNVDATPLTIKFNVGDPAPDDILGVRSVTLRAVVDGSCNVTGGDPSGTDLTVIGDVYDANFNLVMTGTLLTGKIVKMGSVPVPTNPGTAQYDFRFSTLGGLLVTGGQWPAGKDIGVLLTSQNSNFADCVHTFSGRALGTIGPIDPETPPPCSNVGAHSQGFWKNHLGSWPVDSVTVGGVTYDARTARNLMKRPPKGDQTWTLYRQLLAAILNVANGTCSSCIQSTIDAANQWLAAHPLGSGVKGSSPAWEGNGEDLAETLEAYNRGMLCAPRDRNPEGGGDEDTDDNGPGHDHGDHHNCRHH